MTLKQRFSIIGVHILIFFVAVIFSFVYFFSIVEIFCKFQLITGVVGLIISAGCSLIFSIWLLVYEIIRFNTNKKTRFSNWIAMNYPKLILYYVISSICFVSIKDKIIWSYDDLKNVLSLEWTIFGISITIFVVWNIVLKYLEMKKPQEPNSKWPLDKIEYIKAKETFYQDATTIFNSIPLLTANLILMIVASATVYLVFQKINLLNQNLVIINFYFCTNTLLELFMSVLRPIKEKKVEILTGAKVSQEEVELHNKIEEKTEKLLTVIEEISATSTFSKEEKDEMKKKLLCDYCGIEYIKTPALENVDTKEVKEDNQEDNNDQL